MMMLMEFGLCGGLNRCFNVRHQLITVLIFSSIRNLSGLYVIVGWVGPKEL